ncbi:hypothetical protein JSU12_04265 [Escherichia coli O126:H45]|nr:hypothetical protein JSU12_04265 [Escherichia coli O126:H45]
MRLQAGKVNRYNQWAEFVKGGGYKKSPLHGSGQRVSYFLMVCNNCCHNDRQVMPKPLLPEIFISGKHIPPVNGVIYCSDKINAIYTK